MEQQSNLRGTALSNLLSTYLIHGVHLYSYKDRQETFLPLALIYRLIFTFDCFLSYINTLTKRRKH